MRLITSLFILLIFSLSCSHNQQEKKGLQDSTKEKEESFPQKEKRKTGNALKSEQDSISYALGINIGNKLKSEGMQEINLLAFATGVNDILKNKQALLSPKEANKLVLNYMEQISIKEIAQNIKEGEEFLEQNKKRKEVVSLKSGLQYEILKEGEGESIQQEDLLTIHYQGFFVNGKVFDSTIETGKPLIIRFYKGEVLKGWYQALKMMKNGSKWKLYLPPHLAYGEQGYNNIVKPYKTLIFEIEIMAVQPPA